MDAVDVISQDGTRLAALRSGSGAAIVFVHGSFGGLQSWDPVGAELRNEFELWTYARRGYSPSDSSSGCNTFAKDAADLAAVVARTGGRPHVVAASHGATVALHAVGAGVVDVASLTIFEPPLFAAGAELSGTLARFRDLLRTGQPAAAMRLFLREVARMPEAMLPPADGPVGAQLRAQLDGAECDLEAMVADAPDLSRWGSLAVPTLLLHGERTWPPMPETMLALHAALPVGSQRTTLAGQTHFATHESPAQFAAIVRAFIRRSPTV